MKIDIIGSYPPPYGGISLKVKRLGEHLEDVGIKHTIYDTSALLNASSPQKKGANVVPILSPVKWLLKYAFHNDCDVVHLDAGSDYRLRLYFGLVIGLIRRKKLVISINGNDISWPYAINCLRKPASSFGGWLVSKLVLYSLKQASCIITLNRDIERLCLSLGIRADRLITISACLFPPTIREEDIMEIPQNIWSFIDSHTPVIAANASKLVFNNNQDLYGVDMCIDLCARLKDAYPQVGLVFCLPDIGDYEYFDKLRQRITENGIQNNFLFVTQPYQFYPILGKSDIFVRPTNTDGDALSLREALYLRVPSVASDIVSRPEGTILFKNREFNDFTLKVRDLLINYKRYKEELDSITIEDNFEEYMKVYQKLVKELNVRESHSHAS